MGNTRPRLNKAPKGLWIYNTTRGVIVQHKTSGSKSHYFLVAPQGQWVFTVNRAYLFLYLWDLLVSPASEWLPDYDETQLLKEVIKPISSSQQVMMNGVTFNRSLQARNLEYFRSVFGPDFTADDFSRIPDDIVQRMRTAYDVVADPRNPCETFWGGSAAHCTTTGQFAGYRGPVDLGPVKVRPADVSEPELVWFLSNRGTIEMLGVGSDQTARMIEQLSALLLGKAKLHEGSAVLSHGFFVPNPKRGPLGFFDLQVNVVNGKETRFSGATSTDKLTRTIPEMSDSVWRMGPFPEGVFIFSGTDLVPKANWSFRRGDKLAIWSKALGVGLDVPARRVSYEPRQDTGLRFKTKAPDARAAVSRPFREVI